MRGKWRRARFRDRVRERVHEYISLRIYYYDILKSGLGAVPSGVYRVRLSINGPCVVLEQRQEVGF